MRLPPEISRLTVSLPILPIGSVAREHAATGAWLAAGASPARTDTAAPAETTSAREINPRRVTLSLREREDDLEAFILWSNTRGKSQGTEGKKSYEKNSARKSPLRNLDAGLRDQGTTSALAQECSQSGQAPWVAKRLEYARLPALWVSRVV